MVRSSEQHYHGRLLKYHHLISVKVGNLLSQVDYCERDELLLETGEVQKLAVE
jgi:hypothetical protein